MNDEISTLKKPRSLLKSLFVGAFLSLMLLGVTFFAAISLKWRKMKSSFSKR